MRKEIILWILVALAVLGLIGLGAIVTFQNQQLNKVSSSMNDLTAKLENISKQPQPVAQTAATTTSQVSKPSNEFETLTQKMADNLQFAHLCKGQAKEIYLFGDERRPASYCLGENRLVILDKSAEPKVLQSSNVTDDAAAPILIKTETVPSSTVILISYAPDPCTTTGDCGVGMPTNYVTFAYDQRDGKFRAIAKYPSDGTPIWNPAGTKAIFVPDTCGGAGCQSIPLIGYDVTRDATQSVTTDKAVGTPDGQARDAAGKPLPRWSKIIWKNDVDFIADLVQIDGKTTQINGKF